MVELRADAVFRQVGQRAGVARTPRARLLARMRVTFPMIYFSNAVPGWSLQGPPVAAGAV
jgi:hypothetical protein